MNIKIDLEDNRLCKGCPAHSDEYATCKLGHTRLIGHIKESKDYNGRSYTYLVPARPITCFMQSDSLEQIAEIPEKKYAIPIKEPIGQVVTLPRTSPEVKSESSNDILP